MFKFYLYSQYLNFDTISISICILFPICICWYNQWYHGGHNTRPPISQQFPRGSLIEARDDENDNHVVIFSFFFNCGCACGVDNALVYLWADSVQVVADWYLYLIHLRTIPSTYKVVLVEWTIPSICGVVIVEWTIPSTCIILLEWTMPSTCVILVEWTMPWSICGQISPICGQWRSCWNFAKLF